MMQHLLMLFLLLPLAPGALSTGPERTLRADNHDLTIVAGESENVTFILKG